MARKEIKSIRVRKVFGNFDGSQRGLGDVKVILSKKGNKRDVVWLPNGKPGFKTEYSGSRYKDYSDDDIINDTILIKTKEDNFPKGSEYQKRYEEGKESKPYYDIIQDPWQEKAPSWRSFGFDPYMLTNGSYIRIKWLENTIVRGGQEWSDDDGNELNIPRGSTQSEKSNYTKSAQIFPYGSMDSDDTRDNLLEYSESGIMPSVDISDGKGKTMYFSGNTTDLDIVNTIISDWKIKISNYNLELNKPSYQQVRRGDVNEIPYKSPIKELEPEEPDPIPTEESTQGKGPKVKLSIVFPNDMSLKVRQDFDNLKIYVGDPPPNPEFEQEGFIFQDDFDNLDELDDEFSESGFAGHEEAPEDSPSDPAIEMISQQLDKEPYIEGNHQLDLIPGDYVNNSNNKIQLCQINGSAVNVKIANAYLDMKESASNDGINLIISSGFRSPYDTINTKSNGGVKVYASSQETLYKKYKAGKGNLAAKPGRSNHGNGIGFDLNTGGKSSKRKSNVNQKIYTWLVKNSWKFGFIRAVAKEEWHYDYLSDLAKKGPYGKLGNGSPQKDNGSVSTKFYADYGLDTLQAPDWG